MKIISWNCNGKFREKINLLEKFDPDILFIQECEDISLLYPNENNAFFSNCIWIGENKHKGIGVYAKPDLKIEKREFNLSYRGRNLKYFLPVKIRGVNFLNVWNHKNDCKTFDYIGQFWLMLQENKNLLEKNIILGDFNSNSIWDEWDRWWNHSDVVEELKKIGLESVYHKINNVEQGKEIVPTLYLQRNLEKPYHIDYIFAENATINQSYLEIGNPIEWLEYSDHMPIIWKVKNGT